MDADKRLLSKLPSKYATHSIPKAALNKLTVQQSGDWGD